MEQNQSYVEHVKFSLENTSSENTSSSAEMYPGVQYTISATVWSADEQFGISKSSDDVRITAYKSE